MEKIIELLNEYEKDGLNEFEEYVERWYCEWTEQILSGKWENNNELKPCEIISKRYGFIERLVKNDKIDFKSENYLLKSYDGYFNDDILCIVCQDCNTYEDRIKVQFNKIDSLLMILSIQDNPIEYLCSILKE